MITVRLNRLIKAYRIACEQVGDANRGKALPGFCLRRCHKLRQIIWPEIRRVRWLLKLISARRARSQEEPMTTQNDVGESIQSINKGSDDRAMRDVISALNDGARLRIHSKIRKAAIEGLPDNDARNGRTITVTRLKRLEKEGVIREIAMDRYAMADDFELKA